MIKHSATATTEPNSCQVHGHTTASPRVSHGTHHLNRLQPQSTAQSRLPWPASKAVPKACMAESALPSVCPTGAPPPCAKAPRRATHQRQMSEEPLTRERQHNGWPQMQRDTPQWCVEGRAHMCCMSTGPCDPRSLHVQQVEKQVLSASLATVLWASTVPAQSTLALRYAILRPQQAR